MQSNIRKVIVIVVADHTTVLMLGQNDGLDE